MSHHGLIIILTLHIKNFEIMTLKRLFFIGLSLVLAINTSHAQKVKGQVSTTIPYLEITPDSRGGGMGEVGVATSPDLNSQNWNPAKYVLMKEKYGVTTSFTPWLRALVNDINLAYLAAFYKFDDKQAISGSLKYFSLGEIDFTDDNGGDIGKYTPNEYSIDLGYSRLFSDYFSGALALRFIRSDINGGGTGYGQNDYSPGYSYAADLGVYYQHPLSIRKQDGQFAWGLCLSNLGSKISYGNGSDKQFIPANMRLGARYTSNIDEYNSLTASVELSKLMVPTPGIYQGDTLLIEGYKTPSSLPQSWIQSFYDAPGGFKEEMKEIVYSIGLEYWYREQFAIRGGYFHESPDKGSRKYFAVGIGLKMNVFSLDYSYLISTTGTSNPLANTMRFTLGFTFKK
jgi:hypothetical protein